LRDGLFAGLACLLIVASALGVMYWQAQAVLTASIRNHLENLVQSTAAQMDGDLHSRLQQPAQTDSPDYRHAIAPLVKLRQAIPDLYYAYTLRWSASGAEHPVFVLDTTYYIKNHGDNSAAVPIGEVYQEVPAAARRAWVLQKTLSSAEPYTDKWGTFLSAFSPVRDAAGRLDGIVAIDISLANFYARMRPLQWAFATSALVGLGGAFAVGIGRFRSQWRQAQAAEALVLARENAEAAAAEATAANRAKSVFLATMSHEIRTPMNGVLGMAELLADTPLNPEQTDFVHTLSNSGKSLLSLLNDILDYAKIESGDLATEVRPAPLRPCVDETVALFAGEARKRRLTLAAEWTADAPPNFLGDPLRVRQILGNLVGNALKFTERGGVRVLVSCAPFKGQPAVAIDVIDTGPGIPAERHGLLFKPFSQVDASLTRRQGGSGLGLAISRRLAESMGGLLTLQPATAPGACFRLSLAASDQCQEALPTSLPVAVPAVCYPAPSTLRILVVEDLAENRKVADLLLRKLGLSADFATNGEEALTCWREKRPNVILMDVQMPVMDGREASRRIRQEAASPITPWIIALTAGALGEEREAALLAGVNDFIAKPIASEVLAAALDRACARLG